jgi:alpha(1,3/1,4) fucosyltransferase
MNAQKKIALFIDPPSHHFLDNRLFIAEDEKLIGDRLHEPYAYLKEFFSTRGIPVQTADHLPGKPDGNLNIHVSMGFLDNYPQFQNRSDVILSAFFAMECPIVEPSMYRALRKVQNSVKRIFSWTDSKTLEPFVGAPLRSTAFRWPQSFDGVHESIWQQQNRKFLVMINSNKLPRIYSHELYTERMSAIEFFSRTNDIDLYGIGWNQPPNRVGKTWIPYTVRSIYRSLLHYYYRLCPDQQLEAARKVYCGRAKSKSETLGRYTFAICFENAVFKGLITEKIFDCFFSGTIPIYWGAPDITEYVPAQCFIDMRQFSNYADLNLYLKSLSQSNIQEYKQNARDYLCSPQFHPFTKRAFAELFAHIIAEDANIPISELLAEPTSSIKNLSRSSGNETSY